MSLMHCSTTYAFCNMRSQTYFCFHALLAACLFDDVSAAVGAAPNRHAVETAIQVRYQLIDEARWSNHRGG